MSNSLLRASLWSLGAGAAWGLTEPYRFAVRRFDVAMANLPPSADGLTIAQLSDLHCSAITPPVVVRRAIEICNALEPDVVALTGDFVSRRNSYGHPTLARLWARPVMHYARDMAVEVGRLRAREGIFAVPGNHDHHRGRADEIEGLLQGVGVQPLDNANIRVRGLPICGVDDLKAGLPSLTKAWQGVDPNEAQLLLSHNPRLLWMAQHRNCLMLSGHTHGGQVHLPGTDFRRRPSDMKSNGWTEGWYQLNRTRLFVHRGVGSVYLPVRFRCPPEIVLFTLKRE